MTRVLEGLQTAAIVLLLGVAGAARAAPVINYPMLQMIGTPGATTVLRDYDDFLNNRLPTSVNGVYSQLLYGHVLPDRVVPAVDRETGDYIFSFFPSYGDDGKVDELVIDFALESRATKLSLAESRLRFPNATLFYPMAISGNLTQMRSSEGITPELLDNGSRMLLTQGLEEPIRLHLNRKAMRNYRCATAALDLIREAAAARGEPSLLEEDMVSVLVGKLDQQYRVIDVDPIMGTSTRTILDHSVRVAMEGKSDRDFTLSKIIYDTIKAYAPPCNLSPNNAIAKQVDLPGWSKIVDAAQAYCPVRAGVSQISLIFEIGLTLARPRPFPVLMA